VSESFGVGETVIEFSAEREKIEAGSLNSVVYSASTVATSAIGLVRFATETTVYLATESTKAVANSVLDTVIPVAVNAIVSRVDINGIVREHVNVNEIVSQADINPILDRVPMTEIADYVIEEIDLPSLVRESTGGVADGILNTVRFQAVETDNFISGIVDRVFFRKKMRASSREVSGRNAEF
jgi:hypothetical protein